MKSGKLLAIAPFRCPDKAALLSITVGHPIESVTINDQSKTLGHKLNIPSLKPLGNA
jgi:hypothetical protein